MGSDGGLSANFPASATPQMSNSKPFGRSTHIFAKKGVGRGQKLKESLRSSDCRPAAIFSVNKPDAWPTASRPALLHCAAPVGVQQPTLSLIPTSPLPGRPPQLPEAGMPQMYATAPQCGEQQAFPDPTPPRQPLSTLVSMAKDSTTPSLSDLLARCTTPMRPPEAAPPRQSGRSAGAGKSSALGPILNSYMKGSTPLGLALPASHNAAHASDRGYCPKRTKGRPSCRLQSVPEEVMERLLDGPPQRTPQQAVRFETR